MIYMKGLLLLFGESFRWGGQCSRNRGQDISYPAQIEASKSHKRWIDHIKQTYHTDITVSINSYTTRFDDAITSTYQSNLKNSVFRHTMIGQNGLIQGCIQHLKEDLKEYDFILYMRIDIYLKDVFFDIFDPRWDKIMFPSICFKPRHKCGPHPRVNDTMMFIPKKYFSYLDIKLGHDSWADLINRSLTYEDLDMMLTTFHDSDSQKDFNPIYFIVNRPEASIQRTKDIFDKYNF